MKLMVYIATLLYKDKIKRTIKRTIKIERKMRTLTRGGGGKALTMTMTPWNLTHGQWSKNLTMATDILESAPWSMVKMVILWSNFVVRSTVYHFDH